MIVEGLLTTQNRKQVVNVAPMGPIVHGEFDSLTLRPFAGSTTFENLLESRQGVFHLVDQVDVIAEAAIRKLSQLPPVRPTDRIDGVVLQDCCRWFEFRVTHIDTSDLRSEMQADIVHRGEGRPFTGFNRARHAVIEAAILATRLHLLPAEEIRQKFDWLQTAVSKTGGPTEVAAFQMLQDFVTESTIEVTR